jgi:hypothetical protein
MQRPDGVRFAGVRADDEDGLGLFQVGEGVGHGAAAERLGEPGDRGSVTQACAMVDVVGAYHGAHELLEQVVLFVGTAGRREARDRVGPVLLFDGDEALGDEV